jgi:Protein of unknown function (DUF3016)
MTRTSFLAATFIAVLLAPAPSLADVKVRFINPEHYTDAGSFGAGSSEATLAEFRSYLGKLGERLLAPGQNLTIEVLNIDLAGHFEPWSGNFSNVRIMPTLRRQASSYATS